MSKAIYLVRKDPSAVDHIEWLTLSWEEFRVFRTSTAGKGRYFIHLTDDISYEAQEIYIEAPKAVYLAWKKEYDAHLYLRGFAPTASKQVSLDRPLSDDGERLLDRIVAEGPSPESVLEDKDIMEKLHQTIGELPESDQQLLFLLCLKDDPMTVRQAADELGSSKSTVQRQKETLFTKISQLFSEFSWDK